MLLTINLLFSFLFLHFFTQSTMSCHGMVFLFHCWNSFSLFEKRNAFYITLKDILFEYCLGKDHCSLLSSVINQRATGRKQFGLEMSRVWCGWIGLGWLVGTILGTELKVMRVNRNNIVCCSVSVVVLSDALLSSANIVIEMLIN